MNVLDSIEGIRSFCNTARAAGKRIGFVPTMGYLHSGHLAHIPALRRTADVIVASIFVNPTQFSPTEDLSRYPRDHERDIAMLRAAGCDALFLPDVPMIYPDGFSTYVTVEGVADRYEGAHRPTHFRGVATIVAKLFNIVGPHVASFGQKDAQQVAVIRRMARDLDFPLEIVTVETVREPDGLAMSSRNVYLSDAERAEALSISRGLRGAADMLAAGATVDAATQAMRVTLSPALRTDYADIVDADIFAPATDATHNLLGIIAAYAGTTRLIDNMLFPRS